MRNSYSRTIAASWDHAKERVSLHDWATDERILVLGNSEISRSAIDAVNRCVFKRASDITLHQSESFTRRTWFIIDELSEAGKFDGLVSLLKKGRSKGACVVISFQSVSGLRDEKMYGSFFTDEILGQIGNRFIGRLKCPETAEWASKVFGDQEIEQFVWSKSTGSGTASGGQHSSSSSLTHSKQIVTRRALLPSQFMNIAPCNDVNGLTGYFMVREGCFGTNFPPEDLFEDTLIPPDPDVPDFVPRDWKTQFLTRWTPEQEARFGIMPRDRTKQSKNREPRDQSQNTYDLTDMDDLFGPPDAR